MRSDHERVSLRDSSDGEIALSWEVLNHCQSPCHGGIDGPPLRIAVIFELEFLYFNIGSQSP